MVVSEGARRGRAGVKADRRSPGELGRREALEPSDGAEDRVRHLITSGALRPVKVNCRLQVIRVGRGRPCDVGPFATPSSWPTSEAASLVGSSGDSHDNARAESVVGLDKSELILMQGPLHTTEDVEVAVPS